jgi:hypothetical protein
MMVTSWVCPTPARFGFRICFFPIYLIKTYDEHDLLPVYRFADWNPYQTKWQYYMKQVELKKKKQNPFFQNLLCWCKINTKTTCLCTQ